MIPNDMNGLSWTFDHISLNTTPNAERITDLKTLLGLQDGFRPPFPFAGRWLYQADKPVLHLIDQPETQAESTCLNHIAFRGVTASGQPSAEQTQAVLNTLEMLDLPFHTLNVPDEKTLQIFVRVSADLMIELDLPPLPTITTRYPNSPKDQTPHGGTFS